MLSQLQAAIMAVVTAVVAVVVAYVPALAPNESLIITAVGAVLALGILIAQSVNAHAHAKVDAARVSRGQLAKSRL